MDTSIEKSDNSKYPHKLYYDNPEEFERHHNLVLSQKIKENWMEKNLLARSRFRRR